LNQAAISSAPSAGYRPEKGFKKIVEPGVRFAFAQVGGLHFLFPADSRGKHVMPRVSQKNNFADQWTIFFMGR